MKKSFTINEKGNSIRCLMYYADIKAVRRAVICAHGFGGNKDNKSAERFSDYVLKKHKDIVVITYDAPAHGEDVKRKLMLEDCFEYIKIVTAYVKSRFKTDEIYIYANSFGAYQYLNYIYENGNSYRKLALRCPAVNMYDIISAKITSPDDIKALSRNRPILVGFDHNVKIDNKFIEKLKETDVFARDFKKFSEDIIFIHGTKDSIVDFDLSKKFADENNIKFVAVEGADHIFKDPKKMDTAIKEIVEFFGF